jgi:integrase
MEREQRRAGVEVTGNIHILRHTFCTRMAMAGVPTRVIRDMAGHASITTTERYMHLAPGSTQEAVRKLEQFSSGFGRILVAAGRPGPSKQKASDSLRNPRLP